MVQIFQYFQDDPLKILYLIGGSGGIWFWIKEWQKRARVRIQIVLDHLAPQNEKIDVMLKCEIVNLSGSPTSVDRQVVVTAISIKKEIHRYILEMNGQDRTLMPHVPRVMEFRGQVRASYPFSWYRRYKFSFTRGPSASVYLRNQSREHLGFLTFIWWRFKILVLRRPPVT